MLSEIKGTFNTDKRVNHQEDATIINMYAPNRALQHVQHKLTDLMGETDY